MFALRSCCFEGQLSVILHFGSYQYEVVIIVDRPRPSRNDHLTALDRPSYPHPATALVERAGMMLQMLVKLNPAGKPLFAEAPEASMPKALSGRLADDSRNLLAHQLGLPLIAFDTFPSN
jgi:hypothetical protein